MTRKLGFIGLGNMGAPMAENILSTFGSLEVFNRSQGSCQRLAKKGAHIAKSVAQLAKDTDIIFLSLPGPTEVIEIVSGPNGLLLTVSQDRLSLILVQLHL